MTVFASRRTRLVITVCLTGGIACGEADEQHRGTDSEKPSMVSSEDSLRVSRDSLVVLRDTSSRASAEHVLQKYLEQLPDADIEGEQPAPSEDTRFWSRFFGAARGYLASAQDAYGETQALRQRLEVALEELRRVRDEHRDSVAHLKPEKDQAERELAFLDRPIADPVAVDEATKKVEAQAERYKALTNRLQAAEAAVSQAESEQTLALQEEAFAREVAQAAAAASVDPIDIRNILDRELKIGGIVVRVIRDQTRDEVIGEALCVNGRPVIYLAVAPEVSLSPEAFVFFREHEFGHIVRGHVSCGRGNSRRNGPRAEEFEADCSAVKSLSTFKQGTAIVYVTRGNLYGIDEPETRTHPSSRERAKRLVLPGAC